MGYPFDRSTRLQASADVDSLSTFVNGIPNAGVGEITIKFNDRVIVRDTVGNTRQ